ncbi:odorant receptor 49b-like [Aricia agestis]|uniref:odorant receptor 49b-like n=1 Tax=Aricia agestis TaxID=91739 RepID=UPI001C20A341|nr:odorant receptor 49b-like [Aricia agestis]
MEKLSKVMFLLLCHVTSIAKQIVFYADADRIDEVLRNLDAPLLAGSSAGGAARLARTAAAARRLLLGYAGCAVVVCHLWLALTLLARAAGQPVEFSFWTGFDTQPLVAFVPCLLYSHYVITLVGIANTTMDGFMATILYLCKTQLEILREDLRTLPERARSAAGEQHEQHEATLLREFVRCFRHYQAVTEIATSFQDIFGLAIFIQVGVGGGILCMAAYKMASLSVASAEFASMLLFIACILTELFLYCYYGNELKVESGLVASAAYSMRWVGLSARARRMLLLLLLRAGRDLSPAAAGLVPLSLETYVKIIKSSYTFFAVLRQTK